MSEPKLISPMLDHFAMGAPMSDHDGVRCCPAMPEDSDSKYIVKVISIPASQVQLDALLLTGAYKDAEAANRYFQELANGVVDEAKILQRLAQLEGFLPYEKWQVVPMEDGTGYDVYLLSPYKRSLERYCRRNTMTQLAAVNLGLDLCAALAVCRRAGYLYVDLKPGNIFLTGGQEYRIGDLGFISLSSLKYASLPEKYRSPYTAPEIADAFSALNTTVDIYAVGLILYQIFNGGSLPVPEAPSEPLPSPLYADYEMAEIILKACAPDPAQRWQDPIQMGQALVSYMQRNGVSDTPIVPPHADLDSAPETAEPEEAPAEAPVEAPEESPEEEAPEAVEPEAEAPDDAPVYAEDDEGNLSFLAYLTDDETAPDLGDAQIPYEEVTGEVSDILNQADDLISHPTPEPVIPPEPIDVPMPPPIRPEPEEVPEASESESEAEALPEEDFPEDMPDEEAPEEEEEEEEPRKKSSGVLTRVVTVLLVSLLILALIAGGLYYYRNFYLQVIESLSLQGDETTLTVQLKTEVPDAMLTVVCEDTYGNQKYADVSGGTASFTDLAPNMGYTVRVTIDGFHRLTGQTSSAYTTPVQTNIVQIGAVTGAENGSAIVSFTVEGPDSDQWQILYATQGEEERTVTFSGHTATITGLTVGSDYVLRLQPVTPLYLSGSAELTITASNLIYAEGLAITECAGGVLKASWSAPEGATVSSWTVRCYNDTDYDETVIIQDTNVTFEGIDEKAAYTVEVTAANMSQSERAYISENSLTVSDFHSESADAGQLKLVWQCDAAPQDGWTLLYTMDGSGSSEAVNCTENAAVIPAIIPGVTYSFTLQAANGATVLGGQYTYAAPEAAPFSGYGVTAQYMLFSMCRTPAVENWDRTNLTVNDYTTTFAVGEKMSFLVRLRQEYGISNDTIVTLYVVRDAEGVPVAVSTQSRAWSSMWYRGYGEFDVPKLPSTPGSYSISVYLNGQLANTQDFTIS